MGDELRRRSLEAELVPLSVAATVAYFHLTDTKAQLEQSDVFDRAVGLAALALSHVSVLHLRVAGEPTRALSAQEVEQLLLRPARERGERPDLDRFLIRRGDLHRALMVLREAGAALGPA